MPFNLSFDPLSMITGIYTANRNVSMQRETNLANRELAQQQNRWSIEQWNRENAYNDPSAVLSRMKSAGLNPALMAEGNSAVFPAAQSPSMSQSRDVAPQVDPLLMANISKLNAETKSIQDANARENEKQPFTIQTLQSTIDNIKSDTAVKDTQVALNRAFQGESLQRANQIFTETQQSIQRFGSELAILQNKKEMSDVECENFERNLESIIRGQEELVNLRIAQSFHAYKSAHAAERTSKAYAKHVQIENRIGGSQLMQLREQAKYLSTLRGLVKKQTRNASIEPWLRIGEDVLKAVPETIRALKPTPQGNYQFGGSTYNFSD